MIEINKDKCTVCGICVDACTTNTLQQTETEILQIKPESCGLCGHCAAICPTNAITASEKSRLQFVAKKIDSENSEVEKLLLTKRSERNFKNEQVEKKLLEKIIYFAEKAPSSSNKRQREYVIVTDKSKIKELEWTVISKFNSLNFLTGSFVTGLVNFFSKKTGKMLKNLRKDVDEMNEYFEQKKYKIFRNASAVIFYIAPTKAVQSKDDCVIAQQYSMLFAQSKSIGSCVIGYAQYAHKALEKKLNIEKGKTIFAVSTFGFPKNKLKNEIKYKNEIKITWLN
ncbi:MAG: nitroreductase family protein [Bacteroidales bacterium]|nr:nitroreductase family protein [Bacteroidales bacterium]